MQHRRSRFDIRPGKSGAESILFEEAGLRAISPDYTVLPDMKSPPPCAWEAEFRTHSTRRLLHPKAGERSVPTPCRLKDPAGYAADAGGRSRPVRPSSGCDRVEPDKRRALCLPRPCSDVPRHAVRNRTHCAPAFAKWFRQPFYSRVSIRTAPENIGPLPLLRFPVPIEALPARVVGKAGERQSIFFAYRGSSPS